MSESSKKKTPLENGMYNCQMTGTKEKRVYHSSTAETLQDKGLLKVLDKIEEYVSKTMKK